MEEIEIHHSQEAVEGRFSRRVKKVSCLFWRLNMASSASLQRHDEMLPKDGVSGNVTKHWRAFPYLQFIGRHQSISSTPHQSGTLFVDERRFSNKQ